MTLHQQGDHQAAVEAAEALVKQAMPSDDFRESKDASWLLLESALLSFEAGAIDQSVARFQQALESLDYYNQSVWTEQGQALIAADEVIAYQTPPHESVLARLYFALALYQQGDRGNAHALLRQTEELQQQLADADPTYQPNALAKLVLALASMEQNDHSNARILLEQVAELSGQPVQPDPEQGWLLLLVHAGHAPIKVSTFAPATTASVAALQQVLPDEMEAPPLSALPLIALPELRHTAASAPSLYAHVGVQSACTLCGCPIAALAEQHLEQQLPLIAARAVGRHLLRRAAVIAASEADDGLGSFADVAMMVANATTRADVRSWSALPERIDYALFSLSTGEHPVTIATSEGAVVAQESSVCQTGQLTLAQLFLSDGGNPQLFVSPLK